MVATGVAFCLAVVAVMVGSSSCCMYVVLERDILVRFLLGGISLQDIPVFFSMRFPMHAMLVDKISIFCTCTPVSFNISLKC